MALPDIKDAGVLAGVELFGWPWHGLAAGGEVTLINGATRPVEQPQSGNAFVLRSPVPPVFERTPEQVAAAEAAGQHWTNYQLQQGEKNAVIYGKPTNADARVNWIAFAADGSRWHVTLETAAINNATSGTQDLSFTIRKFGVLDPAAPDESHARTLTVSLAEFGFSALAADFRASFPSGFAIRIDALSEDGTLAVLSAVAQVPFSGIRTGEATTLIDYPVAVFSVSLSGDVPVFDYAVVAGSAPLFYQAFTYADGAEVGGGQVDAGTLRVLGGTISSTGSADVLLYLWRPKTDTSYFDVPYTYGTVDGLNARIARRVDTVDFDIQIRTLVAGEIRAVLPMQVLIGVWVSSIVDYEYFPEDGSWNTAIDSSAGTGERILGFGYDDLWDVTHTDPYLIADPITFPPDLSGVIYGYTFSNPGLPYAEYLRRHPAPQPATHVHESSVTHGYAPVRLFNLDIFRVSANAFIIAHHDGTQWNMIQALDNKGNAHAIGTDVPLLDLPYCAVNPVDDAFSYSHTTPRTFL